MEQELTLEWIISLLEKEGIGSKKIVHDRLKDADYKELHHLLRSVKERINTMVIEEERGGTNEA